MNLQVEGPNIWRDLHEHSLRVTTETEKREFDVKVVELQRDFACLECREHFAKYLREHPPWKAKKRLDVDGRDITYFYWTWEFHDAVNKRLRKPRPSFSDTLQKYRLSVCTLTAYERLANIDRLLQNYHAGKIKGEPLPTRHR